MAKKANKITEHEHSPNEQKQQEIFYKFQILNQQAQQIEQQLETVSEHKRQMEKLMEHVASLKGKKGKEILAEIGSGIYVKAELKDENLIMNVGDNKLVGKTIEEVKKVLVEQTKKLETIREKFLENIEQINSAMRELVEGAENSKEDFSHCACGENCECDDECECEN